MGISLLVAEKSFHNFKYGGDLKLYSPVMVSVLKELSWILHSVHVTFQLFTWFHRLLASSLDMQEAESIGTTFHYLALTTASSIFLSKLPKELLF